MMGEFVRNHKIATLNIAGSRHSEWREGYAFASRVIDILLAGVLPK
jgi:hypothetical protein